MRLTPRRIVDDIAISSPAKGRLAPMPGPHTGYAGSGKDLFWLDWRARVEVRQRSFEWVGAGHGFPTAGRDLFGSGSGTICTWFRRSRADCARGGQSPNGRSAGENPASCV